MPWLEKDDLVGGLEDREPGRRRLGRDADRLRDGAQVEDARVPRREDPDEALEVPEAADIEYLSHIAFEVARRVGAEEGLRRKLRDAPELREASRTMSSSAAG